MLRRRLGSSAWASRPSPTNSRQVTSASTGMLSGMFHRMQTVFFHGLWISRSRSMASNISASRACSTSPPLLGS